MTPRTFRTSVQANFNTYWAGAGLTPAVPVVWDNIDYNRDGTEFVHFGVAHGAGTIASLGNKQYRRNGTIVANIYVPEGKGQERVDEISEALLGWFETFAVAGVRLRDAGLIDIGAVGGWWQANVSAGFEYDAFRT